MSHLDQLKRFAYEISPYLEKYHKLELFKCLNKLDEMAHILVQRKCIERKIISTISAGLYINFGFKRYGSRKHLFMNAICSELINWSSFYNTSLYLCKSTQLGIIKLIKTPYKELNFSFTSEAREFMKDPLLFYTRLTYELWCIFTRRVEIIRADIKKLAVTVKVLGVDDEDVNNFVPVLNMLKRHKPEERELYTRPLSSLMCIKSVCTERNRTVVHATTFKHQTTQNLLKYLERMGRKTFGATCIKFLRNVDNDIAFVIVTQCEDASCGIGAAILNQSSLLPKIVGLEKIPSSHIPYTFLCSYPYVEPIISFLNMCINKHYAIDENDTINAWADSTIGTIKDLGIVTTPVLEEHIAPILKLHELMALLNRLPCAKETITALKSQEFALLGAIEQSKAMKEDLESIYFVPIARRGFNYYILDLNESDMVEHLKPINSAGSIAQQIENFLSLDFQMELKVMRLKEDATKTPVRVRLLVEQREELEYELRKKITFMKQTMLSLIRNYAIADNPFYAGKQMTAGDVNVWVKSLNRQIIAMSSPLSLKRWEATIDHAEKKQFVSTRLLVLERTDFICSVGIYTDGSLDVKRTTENVLVLYGSLKEINKSRRNILEATTQRELLFWVLEKNYTNHSSLLNIPILYLLSKAPEDEFNPSIKNNDEESLEIKKILSRKQIKDIEIPMENGDETKYKENKCCNCDKDTFLKTLVGVLGCGLFVIINLLGLVYEDKDLLCLSFFILVLTAGGFIILMMKTNKSDIKKTEKYIVKSNNKWYFTEKGMRKKKKEFWFLLSNVMICMIAFLLLYGCVVITIHSIVLKGTKLEKIDYLKRIRTIL